MNEAQRAERQQIISKFSSGPPAMAVLYSISLTVKATLPFIASLVAWGEAGCGTSCTDWAGLVYLFVGASGAGLLISLLCAFGIWRGNIVAWVLSLVFHLLIGIVVPAVYGGTSYGAGSLATTLLVFNLPFVALLFVPSIRRWCRPDHKEPHTSRTAP
ncbi:common antigen polymerase [Glycomyces buryatensis]|uniref:Common antigen polymerase n=1 Tax=Glycomyces buryatensis TaxID=2570927 RepID=A0A4S8QCM7_9ACTN|nr:common antigen polymerase [Glycomyces buryatensis]THV40635.1 common antigen polymerase [Glycomyces buryatensis]